MKGKCTTVWAVLAAGLVFWSVPAAADEDKTSPEVVGLRSAVQEQNQVIERQQGQIKGLEEQVGDLLMRLDEGDEEDAALRQRVDQMAAERAQALQPRDFRVFWKEGLRLETTDGDFELKIGGRVMNDWAWMSEDSDLKDAMGGLEDSVEFRRARMYMQGSIYGNVDYKLQFDFAGGDADLKDAYVGLNGLPVYVKAGHFKEPMSLEELTSSKYITFMERSLPIEAFAPSRNAGLQVSDALFDKRVTWAAGVFADVDGYGEGVTEGGWNCTGRVAALPWYEDKGARLLHVGASASHRRPTDGVRFRARPEMHLAPRFVDTGSLSADELWVGGAETALVLGPFSLQGEYLMADVDRDTGYDDVTVDGYYVMASYWLTGEHRAYKGGSFSRVKPRRNFNVEDGGWGAWELAARYSKLDLDDGDLTGGRQDDVTVGLNWHLNPNLRVMWNYVRADVDDYGEADLFGMRLQVDF